MDWLPMEAAKWSERMIVNTFPRRTGTWEWEPHSHCSSLVAPCCVFRAVSSVKFADLFLYSSEPNAGRWSLTWCNSGIKPQQSCAAVWNMKCNLINHHSLSCVSINIQSRAEKLFESDWSHKIHSQQKLASLKLWAVFWPWIRATVIIIRSPSQTGNLDP